jgi:hypothetical protein
MPFFLSFFYPLRDPAPSDLSMTDANVVDPASGNLLTGMALKTKDGKLASLNKTRLTDHTAFWARSLMPRNSISVLDRSIVRSHSSKPGGRSLLNSWSLLSTHPYYW